MKSAFYAVKLGNAELIIIWEIRTNDTMKAAFSAVKLGNAELIIFWEIRKK